MCRRLVAIELRRRFDSTAAVVGWASFAVVITLSVLMGFLGITGGHDRLPMSQLVVIGALPATLGIAFAGVVVGVGDSPWRGDRLIATAGGTVVRAFLARSLVCAVMVALVTGWVVVSVIGMGVGAALGGRALDFAGAGEALTELTVLLATSAWLGFGFGAATRSRALALVGMPLVLLVGDTALGFGPSWLGAVRFGAIQAFILEGHSMLWALTSAALWLGIPTVVGALRSYWGPA